jgi:hypothetical protein
MLIKSKPNSEGFEKLEDGMYPAVCISIIGVGTQKTPFLNEDGTEKVQDKVVVTWEVEGGSFISKEYTASLHEKSNLRKDLESWRGKKFKDEDLEAGFDVKDMLGEIATLQVMRNKNDYPTVTAVLPKTKEMKSEKPQIYYWVGEHDEAVFESLPEWIQKKIQNSFEWAKMNSNNKPKPESKKVDEVHEVGDEPIDLADIPF